MVSGFDRISNFPPAGVVPEEWRVTTDRPARGEHHGERNRAGRWLRRSSKSARTNSGSAALRRDLCSSNRRDRRCQFTAGKPGETVLIYGVGFGRLYGTYPRARSWIAANQLSATLQIFCSDDAGASKCRTRAWRLRIRAISVQHRGAASARTTIWCRFTFNLGGALGSRRSIQPCISRPNRIGHTVIKLGFMEHVEGILSHPRLPA